MLEDDIFQEAVVEAPSEGPVRVQHPPHQRTRLEGVKERGVNPSGRGTIKWTLKVLFEIFMIMVLRFFLV